MAFFGYHHSFHPCFGKKPPFAGDLLRHNDPRAANFAHPRFDQDKVIHAGRRLVVNLHAAHDPDHFLAKRTFRKLDVMHILQAQEIRAPSLVEFQIAPVINKAGKIRIGIIDARRL
ncbi:hypothetical protein C064_02902 [Brucella suis 63/252]|nr:hypothetical protein DK67_632 [Brucella suis bv. 3 str. 686]AIJ81414.1 hypothetical protein DK60_1708 [Brucella canis]AIJ97974.1 hypothetical protein DO76_2933 [Brucella suis]ENQ58086.1 hypothetical protein C969_01563 [Brucella canis CNGB 1172]ENQ60726.1 hypothetical protein C979_01093 [Brucella canis UK10/02]ENR14616.1 hypothetical protein C064_02902 [Brucella suis 63/252]ENR18907.1 hypothetical protein C062_01851 [Brucella suis 92/29]ENR20721.1 hypothetical protein C050_02969 [Brucella 